MGDFAHNFPIHHLYSPRPAKPPKPLFHIQGHWPEHPPASHPAPRRTSLAYPAETIFSPAISSAVEESQFTDAAIHRNGSTSPTPSSTAPESLYRRSRAPHWSCITYAALHYIGSASATLPRSAPELLHIRHCVLHPIYFTHADVHRICFTYADVRCTASA